MINIKTFITFSSNRKLARCLLPDELTGLPSSLQFLCSENGVHLGTYAIQSALNSLLQQRHTLQFSSARRFLYQARPLLHNSAQSSRHTKSFFVCLVAVVLFSREDRTIGCYRASANEHPHSAIDHLPLADPEWGVDLTALLRSLNIDRVECLIHVQYSAFSSSTLW
jgi:hypothetical protein